MHNFARSLLPAPLRYCLPRTVKRVVVIGGGPTGLFCADRLRHHFEVTVVDWKEYFEFTPGILRATVHPPHLASITFDYREVLERTLGVGFVLGKASCIDVSTGVGTSPGGTVTVEAPGGPSKLHFDYCIVAVGVCNDVWKPRTASELASSLAAAGASGTLASAAAATPELHDERTLDARRSTLRRLRERVAAARGAVVVGAGLVGVELAAELAHFFPRLEVTLVDGAAEVLPQLGEPARGYARSWLQGHDVRLRLGAPFVPEAVGQEDVVLWCVGARGRCAGLFSDASVYRPSGQLRVNRRMQVLHRAAGAAATGGVGAPAWGSMEALGEGHVFAVGDAAAVEGVATPQMVFPGEEMAAVAVANIEAAEGLGLPWEATKARREMDTQQPFLCCVSLGPQDGMISTQTELLATGLLAAVPKQVIESTKMGALRGQLASSLLWYPLH